MKHNWEYKRLGSLCNIVRGGSPRPIQDYLTDSVDGLNWIKIGDVAPGSKYITSTKEKIRKEGLVKTRQVCAGDFILSNSMSFGRPYILKIDGCIHDGWLAIKGVENYFIPDFLYYYLSAPTTYSLFEKLVKGGVVSNLNSDIVKGIAVPVPPMEVQEQIVAELDKINEVIADCRELLRNLDALAQSLFYDTFGDPVTNPKGWPIARMKDITSLITNGTTPKGGQSVYVDSGITFFRSQNVWRNKLVMDDVAYLDEETNASMKGSMLHHNDILITKTGRVNTENSSLGRSALFTGEDNTANINGHVYLVRLKDSAVPLFVLEILLSKSYRDLIRKVCVGAIDKRQLNLSHIEQFPIILPPLALQQQFAAQEERIEEQKKAVEATIAELQTLLDSRMDYWFN